MRETSWKPPGTACVVLGALLVAAAPAAGAPSSGAAAQLPPEIELDRFLLQAEQRLPPAEHTMEPEGAVHGPRPRASFVSRRFIPRRPKAGRTTTACGVW